MNNSFTPAEFQDRIKKQLGFGLQISGVSSTRSSEAVEAERRQDQAEPCNTALPSIIEAETGEPSGFQEWLDAKGDAMAAPDSFETWLKEREDTLEK